MKHEHPIYGTVKLAGTPLKLSATPGKTETLAPLLGEHNKAIFVDLLGYSKDGLSRWQDKSVI